MQRLETICRETVQMLPILRLGRNLSVSKMLSKLKPCNHPQRSDQQVVVVKMVKMMKMVKNVQLLQSCVVVKMVRKDKQGS